MKELKSQDSLILLIFVISSQVIQVRGNVQLEWTIAKIFKIWTTNLYQDHSLWVNACLYTSTLATLTQIIMYIIFQNVS